MSDFLPPDVLPNIFGHLPPKSLVRFTCVCKSWLSLICDFTSARTTARPPHLLLHFSLPAGNDPLLFCFHSHAHAIYAHGMLLFTKSGQGPSVELLRKDRERRLLSRFFRRGLLGEEEAKRLEEEDNLRERRLLDRLLEKKQAFDDTPPFSSPKLPTMDQILIEIEEVPAALLKRKLLSLSKLGEDSMMEFVFEENERAAILNENLLALLGEVEAEKIQREDLDLVILFLDRMSEEIAKMRETEKDSV